MASPAAVLSVLVKAEGINATTGQLAGLQTSLKKAGDGADDAAKKHKEGMGAINKAAKVGVLAVAGVGAASLKMAGDYEQSLNTFKAVSGATAGEMRKVGKAAIRLGADTKLPGTSAKDAAEAMTELAKGGLSVRDSMDAARPVLQLSAAAQIGNAEAATITARALNGFSLKGKDAARVADLLAGASNASTAEITDIAAGMQQAAASAHQLGVPIEDLTTSLGLMANAGIAGSDAGTSLKTLLASFVPTSEASAKAMKRLGLDVFDSSGKFVGLRKATEIYSRGLKGLTDEQKAATLKTIFGSDATRAANILLTDGTKKFDAMKAAVTKQGTAQELAAAKTKGFKGSLEAMKSTLETLAITFGTVLLPAATSVLKTFSSLFGGLGAHKTATLSFIGVLGSLAAVVLTVNTAVKAWAATQAAFAVLMGPVAAGLKALSVAMIGETAAANLGTASALRLGIALQAQAIAAGISTAATWALNAAIAVLTSPITLVVVAIAALAAGIIYAYHHSETFRGILDGLWATLKPIAAWLVTAGVAAFNAVATAVKAAWGVVKAVTETVWNGLKALLLPMWTLFRTVATVEFIAIRTAVQIAWFAIRTVTTMVWNGLKAFLLPLWGAIKTAGGAIFTALRTVIVGEWNLIQTAATTIWNLIKGAILTPIRAVRDALGGKDGIWAQVYDTATAAWDKIKGALGKFASGVKDGILDGIKGGLNALIGFVNKVIGVINLIPGVTNIKPIAKLAQGGVVAKDGVQALAEGGIVRKPIVMMGEEAPRHPEYVIPTNPAYRKRAKGLLSQAAGAIGYADGGVLSGFRKAVGEVKPPPKAHLALWEAGIVESSLRNLPGGDRDSRGALQIRDSTAAGMGINNMDPYASAVAFLTRGFWGKGGADILAMRNPAQSAGWVAQNTQGSAYPGRYDQVMSQALNYLKGYTGDVGGTGILSDVVSALNPLDFIKKLPGIGGLPDWLKGTGTYVLDKVKDYITDTVSGLFDGGGPTGGGGHASGDVEKAIAFARGFGFARPSDSQIMGGEHAAGSLHYLGRAVDFGDAGHTVEQMRGLFSALWHKFGTNLNELFYDKMPWYIDAHQTHAGQIGGHGDHIHAAFAKGGVYGGQGAPFLGSYRDGGVLPRDGYLYGHQGETVVPRGDGGPLVHIEHAEFGSQIDVNSFAAKVAWKVATA